MIQLSSGLLNNANEQAIATNNSIDETHKKNVEQKQAVRVFDI